MTKNVNELVLDAFRVEHRELLEQIRTLFGSLRPGDELTGDARVQDAFRLAHSFKGGARVCDLREAERLGHGLEAVLEKLSHGDLQFTKDAVATVNLVLDSIEDWMAALDQQLPLPPTSDALVAIESLLTDASVAVGSRPEMAKKSKQLLPVFCQEQAQHSARLRQLTAQWRMDQPLNEEELSEASRVAHTLAGAAAVVELRQIETAAQALEKLFRRIRANQQRMDAEALRQIETGLDAMAEMMRELADTPTTSHDASDDNQACPQIIEPLVADEGSPQPRIETNLREPSTQTAAVTGETVRVSVDSLDRLMRSSSEMFADNQYVARLTRQLSTLQLEVNDLERERGAIRRTALSSIHKLAATPEFTRVSRYLECVDRQVSSLAKRTRQLSVEQRRVAWQLRTRSAQVQRDVYEARLVPAHSIFQGFRKMVRDLARSEQKDIEFETVGLDIRADRMVLQELKDPLMHVLRNCVSHGVECPQQRRDAKKPESGRVSLSLEVASGWLNVVVEDDGAGIDLEQVRRRAVERGLLTEAAAELQSSDEIMSVVFEPGFSTADAVTELAGRGMGLSIVHDAVVRLQGHVRMSPRDGCGTRLSLSVPVFVSTHRVLLVACGNQTIAIPTRGVERLLRIRKDKLETIEGQTVVIHERRPIRLTRLSDVLGQNESPNCDHQVVTMSVVLVKSGARCLAVSVDALLEERDALIMNLDEFAESSRLAGGILLDDGEVALVVQPAELLEAAQSHRTCQPPAVSPVVEQAGPAKVLIVDDSFTTRTLEKNILEAQGYEVSVAIDGVEALSQLRQQKFALVISDIEMPRMDGFALLEQMKADRRLASTPVILVTSRDRQEDQQHGLDLGADAYIVKRKFDHQELLKTIRQVL
jgi:two-component system chemotaxis sensor kinase CheA